MNKSFFAEILTRKPNLVTSMLHFNGSQQALIMPNAIKNLAQYGIDIEELWNDPLIRKKYLSQSLSKNSPEQNTKDFENILSATENVENVAELLDMSKSVDNIGSTQESSFSEYWDFAEESKRLVLINQKTLQELIVYLGTAFNAEEIAQCIEKESVLSIKKTIGLEAYSYALGRGKFQFGNKEIIRDILPSFTKEGSFSKRVIMQGVWILYLCTQDWTVYLRQIFYNKLITSMCESSSEIVRNIEEFKMCLQEFPFDDISQVTKRHAWFSLKKMLTKELAPSCLPYFD